MVLSVQAQESGFGVRGSVNFSNMSNKYDGEVGEGESTSDYEEDFKNRVGLSLGVIYDWGLSENFYIQPGLYFTTRGGKLEYSDEDYTEEMKYNLSYLQIPILASYRIDISDNMQWQINAGPYLAYGVGGKVKWEDSYEGETEDGDYDAFGTADGDYDDDNYEEKGGLKRFDAGLSFGTGVTINKLYVGLSYDLGLANIADKDYFGDDYTLKNRNFSISIGYNF